MHGDESVGFPLVSGEETTAGGKPHLATPFKNMFIRAFMPQFAKFVRWLS